MCNEACQGGSADLNCWAVPVNHLLAATCSDGHHLYTSSQPIDFWSTLYACVFNTSEQYKIGALSKRHISCAAGLQTWLDAKVQMH